MLRQRCTRTSRSKRPSAASTTLNRVHILKTNISIWLSRTRTVEERWKYVYEYFTTKMCSTNTDSLYFWVIIAVITRRALRIRRRGFYCQFTKPSSRWPRSIRVKYNIINYKLMITVMFVNVNIVHSRYRYGKQWPII